MQRETHFLIVFFLFVCLWAQCRYEAGSELTDGLHKLNETYLIHFSDKNQLFLVFNVSIEHTQQEVSGIAHFFHSTEKKTNWLCCFV